MWAEGADEDKIRAPWLEEPKIKRIVERNKQKGENDQAAVYMKIILDEIERGEVKNRDSKVKKFVDFTRRVLTERRRLDYKNLLLHHSGPPGEKEARDIRLNSTDEIHYRPAVNTLAPGYDNRGIEYFPEYECTTPNIGYVPHSVMIAINE